MCRPRLPARRCGARRASGADAERGAAGGAHRTGRSTAASTPGTWCRRSDSTIFSRTHTEFSDLSLSSRTFVLAMNKPAYVRLPRDLKTVLDANSGAPRPAWPAPCGIFRPTRRPRTSPRRRRDRHAAAGSGAHWRKVTEPVVAAWSKEMKEAQIDGGKIHRRRACAAREIRNLPEPQPPQLRRRSRKR